MHADAFQYVQRTVTGHSFAGMRVLEIGSYNVNGSVRPFFSEAKEYIGVDKSAGPGVDVVCDIRAYKGKDFDVVVSTETLEHDPKPQEIIEKAKQLLKPGGMLILTAAMTGRTAHNCNGGPANGTEYYGNIDPVDLHKWLAGWKSVVIEVNDPAKDVYATAYKPEFKKARKPKV